MVLIPLLLYLLATMDAGFIGYRAAAGRIALLDKKLYFRRAVLKGLVRGQIAIAIAALLIGILILTNQHRADLASDFIACGRRMLQVYLPYAAIVLVALALRLIPSVDLRSMTSVLVFGLFVFLRPFVAVAGVAWGLLPNPRWELVLVCGVVLVLMLSLEKILNASYR